MTISVKDLEAEDEELGKDIQAKAFRRAIAATGGILAILAVAFLTRNWPDAVRYIIQITLAGTHLVWMIWAVFAGTRDFLGWWRFSGRKSGEASSWVPSPPQGAQRPRS